MVPGEQLATSPVKVSGVFSDAVYTELKNACDCWRELTSILKPPVLGKGSVAVVLIRPSVVEADAFWASGPLYGMAVMGAGWFFTGGAFSLAVFFALGLRESANAGIAKAAATVSAIAARIDGRLRGVNGFT